MDGEVRRVVPSMRAVFTVGSILVTLAGIQLYVLTDGTDRFFAWTIDAGLSATFLGSFYFMALAVALRSRQRETWAHARVGVYGVSLFVTLTLVATLLHLDKFHLTEGPASAVIAGWTWLAVYVVAPVGVVAALVLQHRAPGGDPMRTARLPLWYRANLLAQGVLLLIVGIWLLLDPASATWWPWALTPLVARAMSAWLLGLAFVLGTAVVDDDFERTRAATPAYTLLSALLLLALPRYADELRGGISTVWYVLALAVAAATGIVGAVGGREPAPTIRTAATAGR